MFGKPLSDYIAFQKPLLILITAVWALRFVLALAGVPVTIDRFVSVTGVLLLAALYNGWAVGHKGFGGFKELYGTALLLGVFSQALIALAILVGMATGRDNVYTIPEFYPPSQGGMPMPVDGKNIMHVLAHVVGAGAIAFPILMWLLGSVVMLVTRKRSQAA